MSASALRKCCSCRWFGRPLMWSTNSRPAAAAKGASAIPGDTDNEQPSCAALERKQITYPTIHAFINKVKRSDGASKTRDVIGRRTRSVRWSAAAAVQPGRVDGGGGVSRGRGVRRGRPVRLSIFLFHRPALPRAAYSDVGKRSDLRARHRDPEFGGRGRARRAGAVCDRRAARTRPGRRRQRRTQAQQAFPQCAARAPAAAGRQRRGSGGVSAARLRRSRHGAHGRGQRKIAAGGSAPVRDRGGAHRRGKAGEGRRGRRPQAVYPLHLKEFRGTVDVLSTVAHGDDAGGATPASGFTPAEASYVNSPSSQQRVQPASSSSSTATATATATETSMVIPTSIFRAYDIRGVVGDTLTEEIVYEIGRALVAESYA